MSSYTGLRVILSEDVAAALAAILLTNETAMQYAGDDAYRAGFVAAMTAVATALGVRLSGRQDRTEVQPWG